MTLASFMRDYVYIVMGGGRVSHWRRILNVLVTFLLVGLWHGAAFTFVIWGLLHGVYLAVENELRGRKNEASIVANPAEDELRSAQPAAIRKHLCPSLLAGIAVFLLVTIAWVFFRAPSLAHAAQFFAQGFARPLGLGDHLRYLAPLLVSAALLLYEWLTRSWEHGLAVRWLPLPARWAIYVGLGLAILLFGELGGQEGIYVQF